MADAHEPVACTLSAGELGDRRAEWAGLAPAVVDRAWTHGGFRIRFAREGSVGDVLRVLAAAEGKCCGWASWAVTDEGDHCLLDVTGPLEAMASLGKAFGL